MMKQVFTTLLSLSFATSAFAATEKITAQIEKNEAQDQFADFVMKGLSVSLEHSRLNADIQMKTSTGRTTNTYKDNTNASAPAMGIAINYAEIPRNNFGWSIGATLVNKTENDSKDYNSLKSLKSFTQLRPELNVGYALPNGIWGMVGGHTSILTTSDTDFVNSLGVGIQASVGYTPVKNFGFDIGYYLSHHRLSDRTVNNIKSYNSKTDVNETESWVIFNQLRARATYYF